MASVAVLMEAIILLVAAATGVLVEPAKAEGRAPVMHRVGGGRQTWKIGVNYTYWASKEIFYVGDWLYFGFDKQTFSVLEVSQTGFEECMETDFIQNVTRGGRDVFNLTHDGPYYFISGKGHCLEGVKLAINVTRESPMDPSDNLDNFLCSDASSSFLETAAAAPWISVLAVYVFNQGKQHVK